ncbi:MAG: hypothetical protein EZS28_029365, partial [Streblomastix strix]
IPFIQVKDITPFVEMRKMLKNRYDEIRYNYQLELEAIEALEQLHFDWHAIWKAIYEAGIKFACESKLCK